MTKTTTLTFDQAGNIKVDATGFVGTACAETTDKILSGITAAAKDETKKMEYNQRAVGTNSLTTRNW